MKTILRLKDEGIAVLVVEQNVESALAVADRVYVLDRGRVVHDGPAAALRDDAARRARCWACDDHDRAAAPRRPPRQAATARPVRPRGDVLARGRLRHRRAQRRRRHGAERLGQDDAVRAHHRQQPAVARAACWSRPGHPSRALRASATGWRSTTTSRTRCARSSARGPTFMLERARRASRRSSTSSTSRSSTRRTATSASCWTSSARCAPTDRLVFLCLHPNEPYHLDILRESCERFVFVDRGRLTHAPTWRRSRPIRESAPTSAAWRRRRISGPSGPGPSLSEGGGEAGREQSWCRR